MNYFELRFAVHLGDQELDLIREGLDLTIRLGVMGIPHGWRSPSPSIGGLEI